ncbi:MAG: DNA translocase FtsK 4TM domain-containing protein, partial [Alistipes sp.]|nr:DNA translocase FtsK 4TM domain-containing protein [Alistipes sp.]
MARDKVQNSRSDKSSKQATNESGVMTNLDNVRLMAGFMFMIVGAFLACSTISYIFYWKLDMSALMETNPRVDVVYNNICGPMGARVAQGIMGGSFGLFALVLPIFFTILGWRLFRFKEVRLHRLLLVYGFVLVMGSLTLAAIFGTSWSLFGSGMGGGFGLALSDWLTSHVGIIGNWLIIIAGWMVTGIIINRNFLHILGNHIVDGYAKLVERVSPMLAEKLRRRRAEKSGDVAEDEVVDDAYERAYSDEEYAVAESVSVADESDIFTVEERDDVEREEIVASPENEEFAVVDDAVENGDNEDDSETVEFDDDDPFCVIPRDQDVTEDMTPLSREAAAEELGIEPEAIVEEGVEEDGLIVTVT